ncbi:uncharacterized protein C12orf71-like [Erethizon dorsatum]
MASLSPSSNPSDTEDCNCETKSTLSLSGGYFPCEDPSSCEDIIFLEDMTPSVCSSGELIPPIQGTQGPKRKKRRPSLQKLLQDDPQQIYKLGITVAWADDNDFEKSTSHKKLRGGKALLDGCPKDETKLTEDLQVSSCSPPHLAQVTHQGQEACQDLPACKPSDNEDVVPSPELPVMHEKEEFAQMTGEASGSYKSGITEPSASSAQPEEDTPKPQTTACLHMGQLFPWLRKRFLSMIRRRQDPELSTKSCPQQGTKRRRYLRGKKIQPEGPLEQLGQPHIPTFSRYVLPHHPKY